MLRWATWRKHIQLGISQDGAALYSSPSRDHPCGNVLASAFSVGSSEMTSNCLRGLIVDSKSVGFPVRVVLADQLTRLFMVTPPKNLRTLKDCEAAAAMRFQQLYGESMDAWQLKANWDVRRPFLACAAPRHLITTLHTICRDAHSTVLSIVPHAVAAWNQNRKKLNDTSWLGIAYADRLTLAVVEDGRLIAIRASQLDDDIWKNEQAMRRHLDREAIRLNQPSPKQLLVCGHLPKLPPAKAEIFSFCRRLDTAMLPLQASPVVSLARMGMAN